MSTITSRLNRVAELLRDAQADLHTANAVASPVESLLVLPLLRTAVTLEGQVNELRAAVEHGEQLTVTRADGRVVPVSVPENEPKAPAVPTVRDTLARMKIEILEDMALGRVPPHVREYGDLHSYVDANEYGGLCEDDLCERLKAHYIKPGESMDDVPEAFADYTNDCQDEAHLWLATGRPLYATEFKDVRITPEAHALLALGFRDLSWHNDACPSFLHETLFLRVWMEDEDPALREMEGPRWIVESVKNVDGDIQSGEGLTHSDDFDDVLADIDNFTKGKAPVEQVREILALRLENYDETARRLEVIKRLHAIGRAA